MRTRAHGRALAVLVALAVAPSCGNDDDEQFAGVYSGDGVDSQDRSNRKEFTLTVAESGTTVSGTYRIRAIILDVSGTVSGTLTGSAVALTLTPSNDDCPYRISGTWTGDRITGTYAAFNCFVRSDGTLDLEKR
jgi:hypothetical protein